MCRIGKMHNYIKVSCVNNTNERLIYSINSCKVWVAKYSQFSIIKMTTGKCPASHLYERDGCLL